jgi:hypothetical protein
MVLIMTFKAGDQAVNTLTGEIIMVLEVLQNTGTKYYLPGYLIRRPNYEVVKVAHFELSERII